MKMTEATKRYLRMLREGRKQDRLLGGLYAGLEAEKEFNRTNHYALDKGTTDFELQRIHAIVQGFKKGSKA